MAAIAKMYGMVWAFGRVSVELKQIKNPDDETKFIVGIILALKQPRKAYRRISFSHLLLPVISVCAVLAQVMLVKKLLLHSACCRGYCLRVIIHERDLFENDRIVYRLMSVLSPSERTVIFYENGRNSHRVDTHERFDYDISRFLFMFAAYLLRRHCAGAGDPAVKVVALSCSHGPDPNSRLSEGSRPTAVGVNYSAYVFESTV